MSNLNKNSQMAHCCYLFLMIFVCHCLALANAIRCQTIGIVDQSGRGDFTSIGSAINSVPSGNSNWFCIHINAGTYKEKVVIPSDKKYIMLKGIGIDKPKVAWSDHSGDLRLISTLRVEADNFVAKYVAFINTYNIPWNNGNPREPAPAAFLWGDKISFYYCSFYGLQDTLYDGLGRHYFSNCLIVGAVDFIFGFGQSVYQDSTIQVLGESLDPGWIGYITANGRDSPNSPSYFIFINCRIDGKGAVYLGRPWRPYARVLFYKSYMPSNVIVPLGWAPWPNEGTENTQFSEFQCVGPGSGKSGRVRGEWS